MDRREVALVIAGVVITLAVTLAVQAFLDLRHEVRSIEQFLTVVSQTQRL